MPWSVQTFGLPRFASAIAARSSGRWAWMIDSRGIGRPGATANRRRRNRALLGPLLTRTGAPRGRPAAPRLPRPVPRGAPPRLDIPLGRLVHELRPSPHRLGFRTAFGGNTDFGGEVGRVSWSVEQGRALERASHRPQVWKDEGLVEDHELEHLVREGDLRDRVPH